MSPDRRVGTRIFELPFDEQGWIKPGTLTMNGMPCQVEVDGTIIVATLPAPLRAGVKCKFAMDWTTQIPRQIRRSGWSNERRHPSLCMPRRSKKRKGHPMIITWVYFHVKQKKVDFIQRQI